MDARVGTAAWPHSRAVEKAEFTRTERHFEKTNGFCMEKGYAHSFA